VKLDGREVTRTDSQGVAHFSAAAAPGTSFRVQIETGDDLRPQSPTSTFVLGDEDNYFLFNQTFENETRNGRRPHTRRPRGPRRVGMGHRRGPRRGPTKIRRVPMITSF
jgi:hypothetical protein